jgi:hypothetical protein
MEMKRREVKPVVMDIHKYLVELGSRIHLRVLDGEICRTHQIYMSQFSNNTAHQETDIRNIKGTQIVSQYTSQMIITIISRSPRNLH